ncbi:MAG: hypothetical protein PHE83_09415 [Opitutaceae bacterium]|nr:hypothetical protein [Opitutaceae bacterium]
MKFSLNSFSLREAESIDPDHETRIRKLPLDFPDLWMEWFREKLAHREIHLSTVSFEGRAVGTLIWRIEQDAGRELVLMAASSSDPKIDMKQFLSQAVDALAAAQQCRSARFHTTRPGLVLHGHQQGWQTSEIVLRKYY